MPWQIYEYRTWANRGVRKRGISFIETIEILVYLLLLSEGSLLTEALGVLGERQRWGFEYGVQSKAGSVKIKKKKKKKIRMTRTRKFTALHASVNFLNLKGVLETSWA